MCFCVWAAAWWIDILWLFFGNWNEFIEMFRVFEAVKWRLIVIKIVLVTKLLVKITNSVEILSSKCLWKSIFLFGIILLTFNRWISASFIEFYEIWTVRSIKDVHVLYLTLILLPSTYINIIVIVPKQMPTLPNPITSPQPEDYNEIPFELSNGSQKWHATRNESNTQKYIFQLLIFM